MITHKLFEKPSFIEQTKQVLQNIMSPSVPNAHTPRLFQGLQNKPTEKIVLHDKSDLSYDASITLDEKMVALQRAHDFIKNKHLDRPRFVTKFGKLPNERTTDDYYFTMGVKRTVAETHFGRDVNGNVLPYCLSVVRIPKYVDELANKVESLTYYLMDPWAIHQVGKEILCAQFHNNDTFSRFMVLLGHTAEK